MLTLTPMLPKEVDSSVPEWGPPNTGAMCLGEALPPQISTSSAINKGVCLEHSGGPWSKRRAVDKGVEEGRGSRSPARNLVLTQGVGSVTLCLYLAGMAM